LTRDVILAKLRVDSRGRLFVSRSIRNVLDLSAGDEVVITKDSDPSYNGLTLAVQREGSVTKVWRLTEESDE